MKWDEIVWTKHDILPSKCARISCGRYTISLIEEINCLGVYELAVFHQGNLCQIAGIHPMTDDWGDDVLRFQTAEQCVAHITKIHLITGKEPENANAS